MSIGALLARVGDCDNLVGTDPDPQNRTSDQRIQIRIWLFSPVTFKTPPKNYIFCLLPF
jgi:hypothetical protein